VERAEDGRTLFMEACLKSSPKVISMFVDFGADVDAQGTDGCCPLESALRSRNPIPHGRLLLEKGATPTQRILGDATLSSKLAAI
jgi:ankyrin repeat protein